MHQFNIGAGIVAIAAVFSAPPASAEAIFGGPIQQNGKCWFSAKHSSAGHKRWVPSAASPGVTHLADL
jgi:hypothetical protein